MSLLESNFRSVTKWIRSYCWFSNHLRATVKIDENLSYIKACDISISNGAGFCLYFRWQTPLADLRIWLICQTWRLDFPWAKACPVQQANGVCHREAPLKNRVKHMQMEYVYPPGKKQHIRPLEKEHHLAIGFLRNPLLGAPLKLGSKRANTGASDFAPCHGFDVSDELSRVSVGFATEKWSFRMNCSNISNQMNYWRWDFIVYVLGGGWNPPFFLVQMGSSSPSVEVKNRRIVT